MTMIKAGTYRFNDVLTRPDFVIYSEIYSVNIEFTADVITEELGVCNARFNTLRLIDSGNIGDTSFEVNTFVVGVGDTPIESYSIRLYDEYGGVAVWETSWGEVFGVTVAEPIKTITISTDTEVSAEFAEWFTANAVEQKQISGVWKFNNSISFEQGDIEETVKFSVNLTYDGVSFVVYIDTIYVDAFEARVLGNSYGFDADVDLIQGVGLGYHSGSWDVEQWGENVNVFDFGTEPQYVSVVFYDWLTANATQPTATVHYNGSTIATLFGGQTATLKCKGDNVKMLSDIVVEVSEIPEPILQEKTVTENGEVLPDDGYDGLSKVTVAVESSGGLAINGIIEQYKVNAGATVNAGDFVEFVQKWDSNSVSEKNPSLFKALSLTYDTVMVVYVASHAIRYTVLSLGESQVNRVFEGDVYQDETKTFTHVDADTINANDIVIGYAATIQTTDGTSYEGRTFVARFSDDYTKVTIGNRWGRGFEYPTIKVRSLKEGLIAECCGYKYVNSSNATYHNSTTEIFTYDVDTLNFFSSGITGTPTDNTGSECYQYMNICVLDESNYLFAYQNDSATHSLCLISISDTTATYKSQKNICDSISPSIFARESETTWFVITKDIYRVSFVNGAFSMSSKLYDGTKTPISAVVTNGRLNVMYEESIISFSVENLSDYIAYAIDDVTSGDLLQNIDGTQSCFSGVLRNNMTLIRSFNVADDGTISEIEMENTGLFVQKVVTKRCPIGIAATSGTDGESIAVYVARLPYYVEIAIPNVTITPRIAYMHLDSDAVTMTITPNLGYSMPETITVVGADCLWNSNDGTLMISNPTSNITIEGTAEQIVLDAPVVSIAGSVVTWSVVENAMSYRIYVDGSLVSTVTDTTIDLSTIYLTTGTYSVTVVASGSPYADSEQSNSVEYVSTIQEYVYYFELRQGQISRSISGYIDTSKTNRASYVGTDAVLVPGARYRLTGVSGVRYGVQTVTTAGLEEIKAGSVMTASNKLDAGWQVTGYEFVADDEAAVLWLTSSYASGANITPSEAMPVYIQRLS